MCDTCRQCDAEYHNLVILYKVGVSVQLNRSDIFVPIYGHVT